MTGFSILNLAKALLFTQPFFFFQLSILVKHFSKSKNMKKLLPIFIAILLCTSCDKEETATVDCLEQMLTDLEMTPYTGQELGCTFFVHQYTFQNKQYYMLDNYCADIAANPMDCDGNTICDGNNSLLYENFFSNAIYHGIVGADL